MLPHFEHFHFALALDDGKTLRGSLSPRYSLANLGCRKARDFFNGATDFSSETRLIMHGRQPAPFTRLHTRPIHLCPQPAHFHGTMAADLANILCGLLLPMYSQTICGATPAKLSSNLANVCFFDLISFEHFLHPLPITVRLLIIAIHLLPHLEHSHGHLSVLFHLILLGSSEPLYSCAICGNLDTRSSPGFNVLSLRDLSFAAHLTQPWFLINRLETTARHLC